MLQRVFGRRVRGASHIRSGAECQDSYKAVTTPGGDVILAVADGHGSQLCPHSGTGSRIAVNVFCSVIQSILNDYARQPDRLMACLSREGETSVAMAIETEWKMRVLECHMLYGRIIPRDQNGKENLTDVFRQYGTTLLGLLITDRFVFSFQIGDGDICCVRDGEMTVFRTAEKILGVDTYSLSLDNAWTKAFASVRRTDLADGRHTMFCLTTDGFSNSYESDDAFRAAMTDYLNAIRKYGPAAVEDNLPRWLSETSELGSGDDITMLIAYFSSEAPHERADQRPEV